MFCVGVGTCSSMSVSSGVSFYDRAGNVIDLEAWSKLRQDFGYKVVARDTVGTLQVTTVWMGLDQGDGSAPPMIFGTIVSDAVTGDFFDSSEIFAPSEGSALANHASLVEKLQVM